MISSEGVFIGQPLSAGTLTAPEREPAVTPANIVDILLVEDNPRDAELTVRTLKRRNLADHVFVVSDGAEALDFVFRRGQYTQREAIRQPKVILLDLKLPKLNGLEVLRAIKSEEQTRLIPVVMLTSSQEEPDIQAAYVFGANSYVVKPGDFEAFQEVLSQVGLYWLLVNQSLP
jgi:two-component system response regulator